MPALEAGTKAPSFEATGFDQKKYSLGGLQSGQIAVLTFFKASCPTCQFALPFLDKLYKHHKGDPNVRFFSVAQEDVNGAKGFVDQYGIVMPVALDQAPYSLSKKYDLTHVPTVFTIQADGTIEQTTVGFVKKGFLELAQKLATVTKKGAADIFAGIQVPDFKPG